MMNKKNEKYLNPSIERASRILELVSYYPNELRMIDLAKKLDINKSSMFNLLKTLEQLDWIQKDIGNRYSIGTNIGLLGLSYLKQFNLLEDFYEEAAKTRDSINENLQLGVLDKGHVVYTGKLSGGSLMQLVTEPGKRFPAYATSIGKILLSDHTMEELIETYKDDPLKKKTEFTITDLKLLYTQLVQAKKNGYAEEHQESTYDVHCVAAPIYDYKNDLIAAVSIVMTTKAWEAKSTQAKVEIVKLANRLSIKSGKSSESLYPVNQYNDLE